MLARHPKTGAPIRIMTSNGSAWKNSKTIVWLNGTETDAAWNRWDIGASTIQNWYVLKEKGIKADVCLTLGSVDSVYTWLKEGHANSCKIIAVPKESIESIGLEALANLNITNMICMEEAFQLYPYLEGGWDGSEHDGRVMLSMILQYGRAFPIGETKHSAVAEVNGLKLFDSLLTPPPLYFITQYYRPSKSRRAKEIDDCLKMNEACPYVDSIILLNEEMLELPVVSPKIKQYNIGTRLRFDIVMKWIYDKVPADAIVCIANSDIYIDKSWRIMWSMNMDSIFFSLLRWDDQEHSEPKLFGPRADSQDTWVVSARSVKERVWNWEGLNFPFGKGGCDNAFNVEMLRQKFLVVNPCMNLITHHVHMSEYRTYDPQDVVEKPIYMYVNPSGIHDLRPDMSLSPFVSKMIPSVPFFLKGSLSQTQKATLLTMRSKKLDRPLIEAAPLLDEFKLPLYEFKNVFQTATGLPRTYSSILIGQTQTASNAWSNESVSIASASVPIELGLIAPCPDEIANNPVRYLLEYMGKILVLRQLGKGEWLGVQDPKITEALNLFAWEEETLPVVVRSPSFQTWCKKAYAWLPQDGLRGVVSSIEIAALRAAVYGWLPNPEGRRIVFIMDDNWITDSTVDMFEKRIPNLESSCIYKTTEISTAISLMKGAWAVVVYGGSIERWGTLWALPEKAYIWEIQPEIAPSLELYQVATAASLQHRFHIVPRGTPTPKDRLSMVETLVGELSTKPLILLPHKETTGFFHHAGDSFREMVQLWKERGYIDTVEVKGLSNVWLNAVGDTLLYDRPTLEWLNRSPEAERKWKRALFGNPKPLQGSTWSFWARRPRIVEELVEQGYGNSVDRELGVVFYGRSENAVQQSKRNGKWAFVCDEFVHLIGEKPYPYTQREYLIRLSKAKWGLCLAGFGNKCHREIECMAMGCVPVVSKEVDMVNYKNPPVEGVHYFRVNSPEDIPLIKSKSDEEWLTASKACRLWWRQNASVEGLWNLTQA
jgi:hypothetical protein